MLLDKLPDSERSMPSEIVSDLQSAHSSSKAALDNLEVNLNEIAELNKLGTKKDAKVLSLAHKMEVR